MSSGFVSGGTIDNPVERDDEWRQAQAELEAARKAKADAAAQHNGKSLFEILQENKDKKQAEFEEKARYKLHVSLDDDEADYLRGLEEKKRKEEASVKKDTNEQLDAFRRQQEEAEKKALEDEAAEEPKEEGSVWAATGRKRKKGLESSLLKGVKLKKANSVTDEERVAQDSKGQGQKSDDGQQGKPTAAEQDKPSTASNPASAARPAPKPAQSLSLGLGYASSDEDE